MSEKQLRHVLKHKAVVVLNFNCTTKIKNLNHFI